MRKVMILPCTLPGQAALLILPGFLNRNMLHIVGLEILKCRFGYNLLSTTRGRHGIKSQLPFPQAGKENIYPYLLKEVTGKRLFGLIMNGSECKTALQLRMFSI